MEIEKWSDSGDRFPPEDDVIDAEVVPRSELALRRITSGAKTGGKAVATNARKQWNLVFPQVSGWVAEEKLPEEKLKAMLPEDQRADPDKLARLRKRRTWGRIAMLGGSLALIPWALITQPAKEVLPLVACLAGAWVWLLIRAHKQAGKPQEAPAAQEERQEPEPPAQAPGEAAPATEEPATPFVPTPREPVDHIVGEEGEVIETRTIDTPPPPGEKLDIVALSDPVSDEEEIVPSPAETLDNARDEEWLESILRRARALNDGQDIEIYRPLTRVGPHAHEVSFRIHGGTADQVRSRATWVASELDISRNWLDMRQDRTEGRVSMWWADQDPLVPHRSPVLDADTWDVFDGAPQGRDQRGNDVWMDLTETSMIYGGAQNFGKTSGMYVPVSAYLLDPLTEVWLYDFKGGGDWKPAAPLCSRYQIGATEAVVEAFLTDLERLRDEIERRFAVLNRYGAEKLTREMAADGVLRPLLVVIDEIEALFLLLATREDGKQQIEVIAKTLALTIKRARAACINVMFSGQRPAGKQVDTGLRDSAMQRICFHMTNEHGSKMVLGDQAKEAGLTASGLGVPGRAVMVRPSGVTLLQTGYISLKDFQALCRRVAARGATKEPERPQIATGPHISDVAAVILRAMGERDRMPLEAVRRILAEHDPATWAQRPEESDKSYIGRVTYLLTHNGVRSAKTLEADNGGRGGVVLRSDLLKS